jgi:hypothetical protein
VRALLCLPLLIATSLRADEAKDRASIQKVIAALNEPAQRAALFTRDATSDVDFDQLIDLHRPDRFTPIRPIGINEPWTEFTLPRVVSGTIRFVTADVATVDAASTITGAVTLAPSVPLLFVMKRESANWKVSSVRVLRIRAAPPIGIFYPY